MTASRRELILRVQFANPYKHEPSTFGSDEPHPAKSNSDVSVGIVSEDDLIGRQRHSETVREEDEGTWWAVSDNRKRRNAVLQYRVFDLRLSSFQLRIRYPPTPVDTSCPWLLAFGYSEAGVCGLRLMAP